MIENDMTVRPLRTHWPYCTLRKNQVVEAYKTPQVTIGAKRTKRQAGVARFPTSFGENAKAAWKRLASASRETRQNRRVRRCLTLGSADGPGTQHRACMAFVV